MDASISPETPDSTALTKAHSELFLSFHYQELKDLGKHFLTVVSGILAFSVTFAEKLLDLARATPAQKALLIGGWSLLIISVVCAGAGLYLNFIAAGRANGSIIKDDPGDFKPLVRCTYRLYEIAGGSFILALISLAAIAALKLM